MKTREETIQLFADFAKQHEFQIEDLLVVVECCLRELSARSVAGYFQEGVRTMLHHLKGLQEP